jgi:hypothetical protein
LGFRVSPENVENYLRLHKRLDSMGFRLREGSLRVLSYKASPAAREEYRREVRECLKRIVSQLAASVPECRSMDEDCIGEKGFRFTQPGKKEGPSIHLFVLDLSMYVGGQRLFSAKPELELHFPRSGYYFWLNVTLGDRAKVTEIVKTELEQLRDKLEKPAK